jgi:hypothetical protein
VGTASLVISEGAIYEGELAMAEDAQAEAAPQRPTVVPTQAPRQESTVVVEEPTVTPSTFIRRLGGPETPWDPNQEPEPENS